MCRWGDCLLRETFKYALLLGFQCFLLSIVTSLQWAILEKKHGGGALIEDVEFPGVLKKK